MAGSSFAQLATEFKNNPRLRTGVWLVVGILWLYGILELQDKSAAKVAEYQGLLGRIARVETAARQNVWQGRIDEAREIEAGLTAKLWREQTQGLAQAAFQDWLAQALQQAAVSKPQLTVAVQDGPRPPEAHGELANLWKVSARVVFDFDPKTFHPFMLKLASHENTVVIESLNIRSTPSPRAEMTLVAYFAKIEKQSASGS